MIWDYYRARVAVSTQRIAHEHMNNENKKGRKVFVCP